MTMWAKKPPIGRFFLLVYLKLMCLFVGCDSMPQGLIETEPNLVWIFRGFSIWLFIRHSSPGVKEPEKLWLGGQSSGLPS